MKYLLILSAILAATSAVELGSVHVGPGPGPAASAQDTLAHEIEKRSLHGGHGGRFHFNVKREAEKTRESLGVITPDPLTKEFIKNEGGDETLEASSLAIQKRSVHYGGHGGRFHFNVKRSVGDSLVRNTEAASSGLDLPDVSNAVANPKRVIVKRSKNYGGRGRFHFNAKRSVGNSLISESESATAGDDKVSNTETEANPKRVIVKRSKNYGGRGRFHFNAKRSVIIGMTNENDAASTENDSLVVKNTETNPKRVIVKRSKNYGGRGRFHFSLKRSVANSLEQ